MSIEDKESAEIIILPVIGYKRDGQPDAEKSPFPIKSKEKIFSVIDGGRGNEDSIIPTTNTHMDMFNSFELQGFSEIDANYMDALDLVEKIKNTLDNLSADISELINEGPLLSQEIAFFKAINIWLEELQESEFGEKDEEFLSILSIFEAENPVINIENILTVLIDLNKKIPNAWKIKYLTDGKVIPIGFAKK